MKLFLLLSAMTFCVFSINGQADSSYYINGFPVDSIKVKYIEAEICNVAFSTRVFLEIDYGQETKILYNRHSRVADRKGNYIEFSSNMDAFNYLNRIGFEWIDSNYIRMKDDEIRVKYLLMKKVSD